MRGNVNQKIVKSTGIEGWQAQECELLRYHTDGAPHQRPIPRYTERTLSLLFYSDLGELDDGLWFVVCLVMGKGALSGFVLGVFKDCFLLVGVLKASSAAIFLLEISHCAITASNVS